MTYLVTQRLITTQWQGNTLMIILNKERARKTVQITPRTLAQQSKLNKISPNIFLGIFSILDDNEHFWFFHINFTLFWDRYLCKLFIYDLVYVLVFLGDTWKDGGTIKRELKGLAFGVVWEGHGGTGTVGILGDTWKAGEGIMYW